MVVIINEQMEKICNCTLESNSGVFKKVKQLILFGRHPSKNNDKERKLQILSNNPNKTIDPVMEQYLKNPASYYESIHYTKFVK
ncbi:MAG: hypothetical protein OEY49_02420 [Candidatus Heimdallarchaeota archaeon]|nr:hypothetical protein [Candidatus Heimdallarchaeota archaeon]